MYGISLLKYTEGGDKTSQYPSILSLSCRTSGCRKRRSAKGVWHFFRFWDSFGHFLVNFSNASVTFFVTFLPPNSFYRTRFAASENWVPNNWVYRLRTDRKGSWVGDKYVWGRTGEDQWGAAPHSKRGRVATAVSFGWPQAIDTMVAHVCGHPLSRYTCRSRFPQNPGVAQV